MLTAINNILYCDDDEDDHMAFSEALAKVQPSVKLRMVASGEELFQQLSEELPDLLFLDINIPQKNGIDCLKEIKRESAWQNLRIVMHSTAQGGYVEQCYALGANLFIPKPLSLLVYPIIIQKVFMLDWNKYVPQPPYKKFVLTETVI
jgi:CheY-like chemotaxis protein